METTGSAGAVVVVDGSVSGGNGSVVDGAGSVVGGAGAVVVVVADGSGSCAEATPLPITAKDVESATAITTRRNRIRSIVCMIRLSGKGGGIWP